MLKFNRLPKGFQELEWIESDGASWIDTNVGGNNNNLSFAIKYQWVELPAESVYNYVLGNKTL